MNMKWIANRRAAAAVDFYPWQKSVFQDRTTGVLVLFCSRQIGKSYVLAAWSVDRIFQQLQKRENESWLVTVLSNSRDNGAEFALKCQEVCRRYRKAFEAVELESNAEDLDRRSDISEDVKYELMRFEIRLTMKDKLGRIKILAANPRTARGFSGDLVLDEFAFHRDSAAIWEAAEPILSRNPEFLCRIASTANGKHNMFYRMVTGASWHCRHLGGKPEGVPVAVGARFFQRAQMP
jgi:phage FluMu gp28-like protein